MNSLNSAFWIGLALAIPLSILGNLITPRIQSWLSTRSESAAKKQVEVTEKEKTRISGYIEKPQHLYIYLLGVIISATFLGSVLGVFSGIFFLTANFVSYPIMYATGQLLAIFGGLLVAKICFDAISTIGKVKANGG